MTFELKLKKGVCIGCLRLFFFFSGATGRRLSVAPFHMTIHTTFIVLSSSSTPCVHWR